MEELTPNPRRWKKVVFRLCLSLIALSIVFYVVDPDQVVDSLGAVSINAWSLTLVGFVALHVFSALKWRFVLATCGLEVKHATILRAYGYGLFANLCLPSLVGGDVVRAGLVMKETGGRETVVFGALVDRVLDVTALGILVAAGFFAAPSALDASLTEVSVQRNVIVIGAVLLAAGLLATPMILRRLRLRKLPRPLARISLGFLRAGRTLKSQPVRATAALATCLGLQAGFVLVNWQLGRSMGIDLDPRLWLLLWPLAKIAAMAPVSLGGIGVREAAFVALAGSFADEGLLLAESLVWESTLIVGGLVAGFAAFLASRGRQ